MIRALFSLFFLVMLAAVAAGYWVWTDMQKSLASPLAIDEPGLLYTVKPGMSVREVGHELAASNVLAKPYYLELEARRRGIAPLIQVGEYRLSPNLSAYDLLDLLVQGRVIQHGITFVEGWTFKQVLAALAANDTLSHKLGDAELDEVMSRIGEPGVHPEGRFFPDTYHFTRGATDIEILKRAWAAMERRLSQDWEDRSPGLPYQTPYEALTMASIIEKETGRHGERAKIAGVFVRRLQRDIMLQTDPTVIYALGSRFDGNIRRKDLRIDNPYNTYRYPGLTPTPIAMPGAAAIRAALHPADGDELYFVAKGDGSHHFAATLKEHNRAVARYQLRRSSSTR